MNFPKTSSPLVSIVMPFYNCEKFISEAIHSFRNLNPEKFEIILVNDSSTDNSATIAYKALRSLLMRFSLINTSHNIGCFKARTMAIEASQGKYIAIADADDISNENRLEKQLKILESDNNIFCCGSWANKIDQKGSYIELMDYPPATNDKIINKIKSDITINPIIDPSAMFRKSDFLSLGGYSTLKDRNLVADMDLWFRALISDYIFVNIQKPLVSYRENKTGNTLLYKREMIQQHVRVRKEFIRGFR